jgi:ubiquinone/menaquinone biosynthesis C-methylase UbiE
MNKKNEWENSFLRKENFLFYPSEEIIRFVSKYIRKQIGIKEFTDVASDLLNKPILDLGCGIGRHVIYCNQIGLRAYGIDLSDNAIDFAVNWAKNEGMINPYSQIIQGDIIELPWPDSYFNYAISHGVLDSMPFAIARKACEELSRAMKKNGLFYCDLITKNNSIDDLGYAKENVVPKNTQNTNPQHEVGTVQSYFNTSKINNLIDGLFSIEECKLIIKQEKFTSNKDARFHLVLSNIKA